MKRYMRWIILGVVIAAAAAGLTFWLKGRGSSDELKYDTVKVDRGRIVAKVSATGTLSALVTVQVGSQVSGRIAALHADFNSQVKKGEILAEIDPQLFEAALEQSKANAAAAQGNLTKAKVAAVDAQRQYDRAKSLAERKLIAAQELDTAQATAQSAQAQVEVAQSSVLQARASLHQAEVNLQYTTIHSPIDGVVISRSVDVGQTVAASLQAPTLFVIAEDLRKMQVDTSVAEADVGKLSPGMNASFTVDAYPNQRFRGKVRQIRNSPTTVQNVVTYDAVIDVENPELKLKPGMTANVTFVYAEKDDVLRLPNAALRFRPSPDVLAKLAAKSGTTPEALSASASGGGNGERRGRWNGAAGAGGVRPAMTGSGAPGGAGAGGNGAGGAMAGGANGAGAAAANGAGGAMAGGGTGAGGGDGAMDMPDKKQVWVLHATGAPERVSVTVGTSDGTQTEIVDGPLKDGDQVITDVSSDAKSGGSALGGPGGGGGMRRGGPF